MWGSRRARSYLPVWMRVGATVWMEVEAFPGEENDKCKPGF